uniref:Rab-GAP TBC domain-containing protein n=1 Tax=Timema douglasi TaxID=61478 RepID=A0A7R8ZDV2_TIMDO|nr:unnamed protein product [Timema douglasi]
MSEWLAVEAIVRQRDKETMAANLAKLSSESTSGDVPPPTPALVQELSNDVFEDNVSLASDNDLDKDEIDYERLKCNENQENKINCNGETEIIYDHNSCKKSKNTLTKYGDLEENGDEAVKEEKSVIIMNGDHRDFSTFNGSEVSSAKIIDNYTNIEHTYENENMLMNRDIQETSGEVCKVNKTSSPDEGVVEDEDLESENSREPNHMYNVQLLEKNVLESTLNGTRVKSSAAVIVTTNPSVDSGNQSEPYVEDAEVLLTPPEEEKEGLGTLNVVEDTGEGNSQGSRSTCVSPVSSQGGVYSMELLETFGLNLHRIDKDVQRCDRNYWYFTGENLEKLRNVMCTGERQEKGVEGIVLDRPWNNVALWGTFHYGDSPLRMPGQASRLSECHASEYVWEHLDIGYMQGMCDLVAPLLVIFDDEGTTYSCFCHLMERMGANFPNGGAMDTHFANMRSLIQILDSEMFELMHQNGDYTHFYFCYRWFLLDFKRELLYEDVFCMWETIWAAKYVASGHFVLFISLALVESYRDIILSNSMDFTDIIKFFNVAAQSKASLSQQIRLPMTRKSGFIYRSGVPRVGLDEMFFTLPPHKCRSKEIQTITHVWAAMDLSGSPSDREYQ